MCILFGPCKVQRLNHSWSTAVISRFKQSWRTAEPVQIRWADSNLFRSCTCSHELNSVNSIRLMWSTTSEPGLPADQIALSSFFPFCHILTLSGIYKCINENTNGKINSIHYYTISNFLLSRLNEEFSSLFVCFVTDVRCFSSYVTVTLEWRVLTWTFITRME